MNSILVVDDMAVFREPIALALRQRGFDAHSAQDGLDALRQMNESMPDLILLDLAMPGMDGLALLRTIRTQHRFDHVAVILLTAISERAKIIEAGHMGVRDYLLKSRFSIDELCARIRKYTSTAPTIQTNAPSADPLKDIKPLLTQNEITDRIDTAAQLNALPPTISQILEMTDAADCTNQQIINTIRKDQAFTQKVLAVANSAAYTCDEPSDSLQQAVTRIGVEQIREVALLLAVMDRFADAGSAASLDSHDFWEHAIATGLIAAQVTRYCNGSDEAISSAFTMGVLHDMGRMVFAEQFSDAYKKVIKTAEQLSMPLEQVESHMLQMNHADLMDQLLHLWQFSNALIDPIALHHMSVSNMQGLAPQTVNKMATLSLANRMAQAIMLGTSGNNTLYPANELIGHLKIHDSHLRDIGNNIVAQVAEMTGALLTTADESKQSDKRLKQLRQQFTTPLRPVYISTEAGFDTYRAWIEAIGETNDDPPNIAIVHIDAPSDCETVSRQLIETEAEAKLDPLPTIILSGNDDILLENQTMRDRPHQWLATPTSIKRLVEAVNALVGDRARAEAA